MLSVAPQDQTDVRLNEYIYKYIYIYYIYNIYIYIYVYIIYILYILYINRYSDAVDHTRGSLHSE